MAQMSDLMFEIVAQDRTRAAFEAAGKNADGLAAKGRKAGQDTAKGMNAASGSVANLTAQFNDIGVSLAGGQSPFLIALQQGSQIGQVLGPMGAAGSVRLLGSAFASLLSPVNLIAIGAVAAGGALYQLLSETQTEGEKAEETIKRQAELIADVTRQWEGAVPALEAYVNALRTAKEQGDLIQASNFVADEKWSLAKDEVANLNIEMVNVISLLRAANAEHDTISGLQDAWNSVSEAIRNNRIDQEAMQQVHDELAAAITETAIPALGEFELAFDNLSESMAGAARQAGIVRDQALQALTVGKNGPALGTLSPLFSENGRFYSNEDFIPYGNAPIPGSRPLIELAGLGGPRTGLRGGRSEADRQAESYANVTQSLQDELMMIGRSTTEQRILQQQRRANVDAASAEGQAIANLVAQIDAEQEAYAGAKEAGDFMRDALKDSFSQLIPEIETGNAALDSFINKLIQASAEAAFFGSGPLASLFGGTPGILGGLFGGGRAVGGGVEPFTDYMVGENGPEIVRIGAKGGVVGPGGRGDNDKPNMVYAPVYNNDFRGVDAGSVARLERSFKELDKSLEKRAVGAMNQQQKRGGIYG